MKKTIKTMIIKTNEKDDCIDLNISIPKKYLKYIGVNLDKDEETLRLTYEHRDNFIGIEKDYGTLYYPNAQEDTIDEGLKWGEVFFKGKKRTLIYSEDDFFLGFKNLDDVYSYSLEIEDFKWNECINSGIFTRKK